MIISTISIRTKLMLTTLITVLIVLILALIYMDATRRTEKEQQFLE